MNLMEDRQDPSTLSTKLRNKFIIEPKAYTEGKHEGDMKNE